MPVTRDLSAAKRAAILSWLSSPGPDGKPLLGEEPAPGEEELKTPPVDAGARVTAGAAAQDEVAVAVKSGKQSFIESQARGRAST